MTSSVAESNNSTDPSIESPPVSDLNNLIVGCVVNSVFSFTAFTGNGLVLGTIWKTPSLHSPSHVLLFGLAFSDFGVGFIVQPLYVTCSLLEIMTQKYLLVAWTTYRVTQAIFVSATVLTLTAVSIDRFLALYLHLIYPAVVTVNRVVITLLMIWMTSVAYALTLIANDDLHRALCILVISSSLLVNCFVYVMILRIARHLETKHTLTETKSGTERLQSACLWCFFYCAFVTSLTYAYELPSSMRAGNSK